MLLYNNRTNAEIEVKDDVASIFLAQGDWEEIFDSTATEVVVESVSLPEEIIVEDVVEDVVYEEAEIVEVSNNKVWTKQEINALKVGEARELAQSFGVGIDGLNGAQVKKKILAYLGL